VARTSPLDAEAEARGNSCYFPLSVEPMLPEALSDGLCSLKPLVPRLVMVADMNFSASGVSAGARFYPAVIRSRARLTYGQIERGLLLGEEEEAAALAPFLPMLREAERLARLLLERRTERGSLDFDLPEAEFRFDEKGRLTGIAPRRRHFGHRIIEECMIAANEAVAAFLEERGEPVLYRVHQAPDPDKLMELMDYLGRSAPGGPVSRRGRRRSKIPLPTGKDLQRILAEVRGTPREYPVTRLVLRTMMQARYQPENEGHFGLASACYCHFTSPIRRYADLLAHRALKSALGLNDPAEGKALTRSRLESLGARVSLAERTAMEAEREIHKRLCILLLRDRVGEIFDGIVSGVTDFGIFVELPEVSAEGMASLAGLDDDYYDYVPERRELRGRRTRRTFALGGKLRVRLTDVHPARLEISLAILTEGNGRGGAAPEGTRARRAVRKTKKRSAGRIF
jgi:ribonuclease R